MTEAGKPLDALRERDMQWRKAIEKCARERGMDNVYAFLNEYAPDMLAAHAEAAPACNWFTPEIQKLAEYAMGIYLNNTGRSVNEQWGCVVKAVSDRIFAQGANRGNSDRLNAEMARGGAETPQPATGHGEPAPGCSHDVLAIGSGRCLRCAEKIEYVDSERYEARLLRKDAGEPAPIVNIGRPEPRPKEGDLLRVVNMKCDGTVECVIEPAPGLRDEWTARMDEHGILCRECQHLPNGEMTHRCARRLELEALAAHAAPGLREVDMEAEIRHREHNYFYMQPHGERKTGFYYCLCGWEGPDRKSYWEHLPASGHSAPALPIHCEEPWCVLPAGHPQPHSNVHDSGPFAASGYGKPLDALLKEHEYRNGACLCGKLEQNYTRAELDAHIKAHPDVDLRWWRWIEHVAAHAEAAPATPCAVCYSPWPCQHTHPGDFAFAHSVYTTRAAGHGEPASIDAAFEGMASDEEYRREAEQISGGSRSPLADGQPGAVEDSRHAEPAPGCSHDVLAIGSGRCLRCGDRIHYHAEQYETRLLRKGVGEPAPGLREAIEKRDLQWRGAIYKCADERGIANVYAFLNEYAPDRAALKGASERKTNGHSSNERDVSNPEL